MHLIPTFSHLESAGLLYGFFFALQITEVLFATGLIFLPLIAGVVRLAKNTKGAKEGHRLPDVLLNYILLSGVLIIFCLLPVFAVSTNQILINDGCTNGESRNLYDADTLSSNQWEETKENTPKTTFWWVLWHKLGGGIINALIQNTPCHTDHNLINTLLSTQTITDPQLRSEYRQFYRDCYLRAYNNYVRTVVPDAEVEHIHYIGNQYFVNTPGFYKKCGQPSLNPTNPCYNGSDPGPPDGVPGWQGKQYPTCDEWWLGDGKNDGLRDLLYAEAVDDSMFCGLLPKALEDYLVNDDKDEVIRNMLDNVEADITLSASDNMETAVALSIEASKYLRNFSASLDQLSSNITQPYITKKLMVLMQPVVLMALMVFFPIFFWVASYRIKSLMLYTAVLLAVKSLPATIAISSYLSNFLGPSAFKNWMSTSAISRAIFLLISAWIPVIMVLLLFIVLGWAGAIGGKMAENALVGRGIATSAGFRSKG